MDATSLVLDDMPAWAGVWGYMCVCVW